MKVRLVGHVKALSLMAPDKVILEISLPAANAQAALTLFIDRSEVRNTSPGDTVDLELNVYDPKAPRQA